LSTYVWTEAICIKNNTSFPFYSLYCGRCYLIIRSVPAESCCLINKHMANHLREENQAWVKVPGEEQRISLGTVTFRRSDLRFCWLRNWAFVGRRQPPGHRWGGWDRRAPGPPAPQRPWLGLPGPPPLSSSPQHICGCRRRNNAAVAWKLRVYKTTSNSRVSCPALAAPTVTGAGKPRCRGEARRLRGAAQLLEGRKISERWTGSFFLLVIL